METHELQQLLSEMSLQEKIGQMVQLTGAYFDKEAVLTGVCQYTPYTKNPDYPQLNRRITSYEYNKVVDTALELVMTDGFMQQKSSAKEEYTPPFNLEGL